MQYFSESQITTMIEKSVNPLKEDMIKMDKKIDDIQSILTSINLALNGDGKYISGVLKDVAKHNEYIRAERIYLQKTKFREKVENLLKEREGGSFVSRLFGANSIKDWLAFIMLIVTAVMTILNSFNK